MTEQLDLSLERRFFQLFEDNEEAMDAYYILKYTNYPVFLNGKAGTGKSTFINLIQHISESICLVTASTGIAARNINGVTVHSQFHLPFGFHLPSEELIESIRFKEMERIEITSADLIIIDEISMVSSLVLDTIDLVLQKVCCNDKPFGGKRVLMVGDPFQLPPIIGSGNISSIRSHYNSEFFFDANVFKRSNPVNIELKMVYRQNEQRFLDMLQGIRLKLNIYDYLQGLNKACKNNKQAAGKDQGRSITLTFTNSSADSINQRELEALRSEEFTYKAEVRGVFDCKSVQIEKVLLLKVGARVMFIKNHSKGDYVNGSMGYVTDLTQDSISVRLDEGQIIAVEKEYWSNNISQRGIKNGKWQSTIKELGWMSQYPLKLAWAITVHKSQGLTFDNVFLLNDSNAFAAGQLYVALSRCRSLSGLRLFRPVSFRDVKIDQRIAAFYDSIRGRECIDRLLEEIVVKLEDNLSIQN